MSLSSEDTNTETGQAFKVRLKSTVQGSTVIFNVTPDIIENRNVNYRQLEPVHLPGQIRTYQNTSSRTYQLSNVKIVSRTPEEATENLRNINILRSWSMPYFGHTGDDSTLEKPQDASNYGAPPDILLFSAYSPADAGQPGNIRNIPVVMQQISIPYPSDVDYIATTNGTPFPMLMVLDMSLLETQSPRELHEFDLSKYRAGVLPGF